MRFRSSRERYLLRKMTAPESGQAFWRRRAAAYGKNVWSWRPLLVSSRRRICRRARHSLHPLLLARNFLSDPGRFAPQDREAMFAIRGMVESRSRSVLDAPRSLGMTEIDDLTRPFRRTQSRARRQTGRRVAQ